MIIKGMTTASLVPDTAAALNGVAALPHLGVIRATGEQAATFLQGQLTQDMALMAPGQARLAAFCNAKGRMLASFVACRRTPDDFLLVCSRDLLPAMLKRLSMFVLRAKVKLSDATEAVAVHGLIGSAASSIAVSEDSAPAESQFDTPFFAALPPADGAARVLWLAPAGTPAPAGGLVTAALWDFAAVRSGVATLSAPVAEAFVPQMLNYESAGGVNFKKGCYPGQEVVARSQFRGVIKRRAYVAHVEGQAQAGQEVFWSGEPAQPAGLVAQAAPAPGGGSEVIASLQVAAVADGGVFTLGAPDGPALSAPRLPYRLLDDI